MKQSRLRVVSALIAVALASCTTTLRGRKTLGVPQEPQIREGIPFRMPKPVFVLVGKSVAADKVEYDVGVEYVADPDEYYLVTIDPALLHTNTFGLSFGTSGTLKKVSSQGTQQVGPMIAAVGSFAVSALTGVGAIRQIGALKDATGVSPLALLDFGPNEPPPPGLQAAIALETAAPEELLRRIEAVGKATDSGPLERKASASIAERLRAKKKDGGVPTTQAERSVLNTVRQELEKDIDKERDGEASKPEPLQFARRLTGASEQGYEGMRRELISVLGEVAGNPGELGRATRVGLLFLTLGKTQGLLAPQKKAPKPPPADAPLYDRVKYSVAHLDELAEQAALAGSTQPTPAYLAEEETLHNLAGTRDKLDQRRTLQAYMKSLTGSFTPAPSAKEGAKLLATIQAAKDQIDALDKAMKATVTEIITKGPPGAKRTDRAWRLQEVRPSCLRWHPESCGHPKSDAAWVKHAIQGTGDCGKPAPGDFPEFVIVLERGDQR